MGDIIVVIATPVLFGAVARPIGIAIVIRLIIIVGVVLRARMSGLGLVLVARDRVSW